MKVYSAFSTETGSPQVISLVLKAVAARLPAFPGIGDLGLVETNGHQNFRNWETMRRDLAHPDAHWTRTERGVFECDADYWAKSGGILEPMPRYEKMYERLQG